MRKNVIAKYVFLALASLLLGCDDSDSVETVLPESELSVNPEEIVFQKEGGETAMTISTNRGWCIGKDEGVWFKVDGESTGVGGEHSVNFSATENFGTEKRVSKITIQAGTKSQELNVTQFGSEPDMVIPEKEIRVDYNIGERAVVIHSNAEVKLTSAAEWITLSGGYTLNSTQFMMSIKDNPGEERRGILTAKVGEKEETITVIQKAWEAKISLSAEVLAVSSQKRMGSVMLNASGDWMLEFEEGEQPDWIVDVPVSGGKGDTELLFTFKPNETDAVHQCRIIIHCGEKRVILDVMQNKPTLRERDSLTLVNIYNNAVSHGIANWDFSKPLTEWAYVQLNYDLPELRVSGLHFGNWIFDQVPAEIGEFDELKTLTFASCTYTNLMLPAKIGNLVNLVDFTCIGDKALKFPEEITQCVKLEKVTFMGTFQSVGGNTIMQGVEMSKELCKIKSLNWVSFESTDIRELPEELSETNVSYLRVETGKLTQIPSFLGKMQKLTYLTIRNCDIEGTIPPEIFDAPLLKSCILSKSRIKDVFPKAAFKAPKLYELILGDNLLTGDLPKELVDSKITVLDVSQNMLGGVDAKLDYTILEDKRFGNDYAWAGKTNICMQKDGYGWINCK
ncbi:BACON domain-containing carbohydrate-binding protein [Butyricimonas hominis]|uniref:BACON domain-containing protein n=1 Tax=Butyricimonas hominis TaxID=2763032 RepID=UPI0035135695